MSQVRTPIAISVVSVLCEWECLLYARGDIFAPSQPVACLIALSDLLVVVCLCLTRHTQNYLGYAQPSHNLVRVIPLRNVVFMEKQDAVMEVPNSILILYELKGVPQRVRARANPDWG